MNAWKVVKGEIEKINLFSNSNIPALLPNLELSNTQTNNEMDQASMYVGIHEKQLYIQHNGNMESKVKYISEIFGANNGDSKGDYLFPFLLSFINDHL